ncbi:EcoRII N-terminal effector-binding domain-containing protein [Pseudomonas sp. Marseille-P9899]|uniref:EcoRII N-terminal effector-binding domain-containing protein n=1 Tax=Pseudomonas sp. Marseille-P9899 TaxID=2730401 RepID=UPI00158C189A|nr:EcoRII N-terminal effector-binding domain-containing protein [Pseudomonas sp. Marseille-P9899]
MTNKAFRKTLSANDVGSTGGHQGGILIPKSETELLAFLPPLDPDTKNPNAWIDCEDETGKIRRFRLVYYNNKFHDERGTRNEYRITHMTKYLREVDAKEGEAIEIYRNGPLPPYRIRLIRSRQLTETIDNKDGFRIKLKSNWSRAH